MTSRDFCYWLQGYLELAGSDANFNGGRILTIKDHLNMVFKHEIDPSFGSKEHVDLLKKIHNPQSAINC